MTTPHASSATIPRQPSHGAGRKPRRPPFTRHCVDLGVGISLALLLGACNGRLIVVNRGGGADQSHDGGTDVLGTSDNAEKQSCSLDSECSSKVCRAGHCQDPACDDGVQNGLETGVDCGGGRCQACVTSCVCASSDALMALGCDPRPDSPYLSSVPRLSDDGSVVLFESTVNGNSNGRLYFWTAETGVRLLDGTEGGAPLGISGDGRLLLVRPGATLGTKAVVYHLDGSSISTGLQTDVVVQKNVIRMGNDGSVAGALVDETGTPSLARWTEGRGTEMLSALPGPNFLSLVGVGPGAANIVGSDYRATDPGGPVPLRWTDTGGLVVAVGALPDGATRADFRAASRDASVVIGFIYADQPTDTVQNPELSVFSPSGVVALADPSAAIYDGNISADGSTIAGIMGQQNYRYTADSGIVPLVLGARPAQGLLLSADGSVLLGGDSNGGVDALILWDTLHGARSVRTTLAAQGVDFSGWATIAEPLGLSSDGKVAIGYGTCGSRRVVYRIVLPD
jgi:hypothetical protein